MQPHLFLLGLFGLATAQTYFTLTIYSPNDRSIDGMVVNARDKAFMIGAASPSTYCGLKDPRECPPGRFTMSAVPGGQAIFVTLDGSLTYSSAHSSLRPPGARVDGFYPYSVFNDVNVLIDVLDWRPNSDPIGLWACPVAADVPVTRLAVLKASTVTFRGKGCSAVDGVRINAASSSFAAWEYT